MNILQLSETERICEVDGIYQLERRYDREGTYQWFAHEFFGSIREAVEAAAYRDIHALPNDDLTRWNEASEKVLAKYKSLLSRALESRPAIETVT